MTDPSTDSVPFFTVITCTYNRADLIRRALDSLLLQSCDDWECIIVDDSSTDNTSEVVAPYLGEKIHYLRQSHRGCALSKNAGMEAATGKYITFLDSDDEYMPDHLAIRKKFLEQQGGTDLLHGGVKVIGNPFVPDKDYPDKLIAIVDCVVGGTFVIRRESLRAEDRFSDVYSDDSAFLERFAAAGKMVKEISSPTYLYHRDSPDSMCDHL